MCNNGWCCRCEFADDFIKGHISTYRRWIKGEYQEEDEAMESGETANPEPKFPDRCSRIRIAILDTGLDMNHPYIKAREDRIKDIRSWVNDLDGKQEWKTGDASGHGTHVASLLLDVAPDCDIYIARIAEIDPVRPDQIARVSDAAPPVELELGLEAYWNLPHIRRSCMP
jgi:hypothetical protein